MKHLTWFSSLLFIFVSGNESLHAQSTSEKKVTHPFRKITIQAMYSYHVKESLSGYAFELGNEIKLQSKLYFYHSIGFTVHTGKDPKNAFASQTNVSIPRLDPLRFTTGGLQYNPVLQFEIVPNLLKLGAGGLIRYQTTSWPDRYAYFSSESASSPIPPHYEIYEIHPHTISTGLRITTNVEVIHQQKYTINMHGFMQKDSNKDLIYGAGMMIALKYVKSVK